MNPVGRRESSAVRVTHVSWWTELQEDEAKYRPLNNYDYSTITPKSLANYEGPYATQRKQNYSFVQFRFRCLYSCLGLIASHET